MRYLDRLLGLCLVLMILFGCGVYQEHDEEPDDAISHAIKDEFDDLIFYQGKQESKDGIVVYNFLIREEKRDTVEAFANYINEMLYDTEKKVSVRGLVRFAYGTVEAFELKNYSDNSLVYPNYDNLSCLYIGHIEEDHDAFWDDYTIYFSFSDIKYLEISDYLFETSNAEGVDWYEIYPGLEDIIVYDTDD